MKSTLFIEAVIARHILSDNLSRKKYAIVILISHKIRITRVNDLIRIVTLHATVMASGSLTYLMGRGVASYDSYQVSYF